MSIFIIMEVRAERIYLHAWGGCGLEGKGEILRIRVTRSKRGRVKEGHRHANFGFPAF